LTERRKMRSLSMKGRDLVSILDFSRKEIERLFHVADDMQRYTKMGVNLLSHRIMSTLFFEPSTRTRLSFETAMQRLGGGVTGFADPSTARVVTGESIADTIRMVDSYSNVIVLRHRIEGSAKLAAEIANMPVINGGDGSQHHPTQTLTDLYTIDRELGHLDDLKIAILGDLRQTRSASSLSYGVSLFRRITLFLISPKPLRMRAEVVDHLKEHDVESVEDTEVEAYLPQIDVLYVTRLQKERFEDQAEYERMKGSYMINARMLGKAKKRLIVMHHLPRIDEIPLEVDYTPNARYFVQAANGLPVRMALLSLIVQ